MRRTLLLLTLSSAPLFLAAQDCTDLFFSEYCEGSSQNKALEIYNPTLLPIDLSQYVIKRYSNGSFTATESFTLVGTLAASQAFVVANGQLDSAGGFGAVDPALYALADLPSPGDHDIDPMYFNGDDALTLERTNGTIVDIIGEVGVDPGSGWTDDATANYTDANGGTYWTKDQTLVRKPSVKQGVTSNPTPFNVTLEWDSLPTNTWTGLGQHVCECATVDAISESANQWMVFAPNPSENGTVMIKATKGISAVDVFDTFGRVVYSAVPTQKNGTMILDIPNAAPGLYMVHVALEGGARLSRELMVR